MSKQKKPRIDRKNTCRDFHLWVGLKLGKAIEQHADEQNRTLTGQIRNDLEELYGVTD